MTCCKPEKHEKIRRAGRGFLEVYESPLGVMPVAHVVGEPEEMGRQYGTLVGDTIRTLLGRFVGLFSEVTATEAIALEILDGAWERLAPHAPERYVVEMAGIAEGANLPLADVRRITAATNLDLYKREERLIEFLDEDARAALTGQMSAGSPAPMSCTMFAVWGSRTVDGKLYAHRNLDWISQAGIHEDRLITVRRPEGKAAFVSMDYAGIPGVLAGMNEHGITLSEVGAFSVREELDGIPWVLMARQVLEESACLEDAVGIVQAAKHTIGYNYLVADGDAANFGTDRFNPRAAAFETNFECCETFYANDPKEASAAWINPDGNPVQYGCPLKEAVFRGDTAFGERTRALQATDNGPGEPENDGNPFAEFLGNSYLDSHLPMHDMIRAYETGTEYVYPFRNTKVIESGSSRKIGPEEALAIAATVAHNTETLCNNDWNVMSVVYAATDGEFWVAYESRDDAGQWKNAPDLGYWRFSLCELLEAEA